MIIIIVANLSQKEISSNNHHPCHHSHWERAFFGHQPFTPPKNVIVIAKSMICAQFVAVSREESCSSSTSTLLHMIHLDWGLICLFVVRHRVLLFRVKNHTRKRPTPSQKNLSQPVNGGGLNGHIESALSIWIQLINATQQQQQHKSGLR